MMVTPLFLEWEARARGVRMPDSFRRVARDVWDWIEPDIWRDHVGAGPVLIEGGRYQPHNDGEWVFLTPITHIDGDAWRKHVWGGCCTEDEARLWFTEIVDIVAWHPATPGRWARRTGEADMLGAVMPGEAVRVHQTPLGWLRGGGEGVCFLDDNRVTIAGELRQAARVIAESPAHARLLREICERPYPIPKIVTA